MTNWQKIEEGDTAYVGSKWRPETVFAKHDKLFVMVNRLENMQPEAVYGFSKDTTDPEPKKDPCQDDDWRRLHGLQPKAG